MTTHYELLSLSDNWPNWTWTQVSNHCCFFTQAQRYLGVFYIDEDHQDTEKAVYYFGLAAKQNVCTYISLCPQF